MAKEDFLVIFGNAQRGEHFLLQVRFVNTDTSASDFNTVQDDVVRFGAHLAELLFIEQWQVLGFRSGERMMDRIPFVLFRAPLQQWEIGDPKKIKQLRTLG